MTMNEGKVFHSDLERIYQSLGSSISKLDNKSFLITGGTGFFGVWLLSFLDFAKTELNFEISAEVISRRPEKFLSQHPEFANKGWISWNRSDIRNVELKSTSLNYVIHGATTNAVETYNGLDPLEKFSVTYDGTKRILDKIKTQNIEKFLFMSSGSVYGETFSKPISEIESSAPLTNQLGASIGHAKRAAEFLCLATMASNPNINVNIARCFSFVGPYLPTELHYAIGNFINDASNGRPIVLKSFGESVRSYLYMSDAVSWLIQILFSDAQGEIFNVGSEESVTIKNLAKIFSTVSGSEVFHDHKETMENFNTSAPSYYVPNTSKIRNLVGVEIKIDLIEAVTRSLEFHRSQIS